MNHPICPQCQSPVSEELPGGLCPTCLMAAAARVSLNHATGSYPETGRKVAPTVEEMATLFPELEILELTGQGGMGIVYRVRQRNLDRIVALKVFMTHADDAEFAARFQREARVLAKLNHPNIVTVHDFGQRGKAHYLIMEYVDGMNLRQLAAVEKITPQMALQMVPQLCDALQYAHDSGVIHRDIKPENLLVSTTGGIKIADFGLAKMTGNGAPDTLTRTQQVMGTLNYMAPEQRERPTEVDHRADIYSLGVVIYELLTGELPMGRFQPPSSKSDLDARLDEAVMRALEREPARRYQKASEFKQGLSSPHNSSWVSLSADAASNSPGWYSAGRGEHNHGSHEFANHPLPAGKPFAQPDAQAQNETRYMFTVMSGRERKGNWYGGQHQVCLTMMGGAELDLTEVDATEVNLTLLTLMGGTEIIVPQGTQVDLDGLIVMGAITDKVPRSVDQPCPMRVRIRAWGAMGGCEVRSPKVRKKPGMAGLKAPAKPVLPAASYRGTAIGRGLVFLYRLVTILISVSIPIMFVSSSFLAGGRQTLQLAGTISALVAVMAWYGLKYFRVVVRGGADTTSQESIDAYESATVAGSFVRGTALMALFCCPLLFVTAKFDPGGEDELKLAAIVCGVIAVALFTVAKYTDDFIRGDV